MTGRDVDIFQLPRGVKVLPPRGAHRREWVRRTLLDTFHAWGFMRVITPAFEYLDLILRGLEKGSEERVYKLVERETGRLVALRPDFTPQVARIAATVLQHYPRPLRLCYGGEVFRHMAGEGEKEIYQVGVELIGLDLPEADAEMIAMAAGALENLGIDKYSISVGHVGLVRKVLASMPPDIGHRAEEALVRKNRTEMARISKDLPNLWRETLQALPTLCGGIEVLERAKVVLRHYEGCTRYLDYLGALYAMVDVYGLAHKLVLDLSEIRGFQYYTGMVFEVFAEGVGGKIGGGGRYDNLLARFGKDEPATGFGVNVDAILRVLEHEGIGLPKRPVHYLIVDFSRDKREALTLAKRLRHMGWRVARDIIRRDLKGSVEYAKEMDIEAVIVMDEELKSQGKVLLIRTATGKEAYVSVGSLLVPKGGNYV